MINLQWGIFCMLEFNVKPIVESDTLPQTVFITGGMGFFGWNAYQYLALRGVQTILGSSRLEAEKRTAGHTTVFCDITDKGSIEAALKYAQPDCIIHAAALSAPLLCEKEPELAYHINVHGTKTIFQAAQSLDIPFVFLSSDLVFNGDRDIQQEGAYTEQDAPNARIVYGLTKIAAERMIMDSTFNKAIIVRSSLMFGGRVLWANGFPHFAVDALRANKPTTLFTDQYRTPAYIPDIVRGIIALVEGQHFRQIIHCGGAERLNRVEFVERFCVTAGVEISSILARRMDEVPEYTTRVRDVSLDSRYLTAITGLSPTLCDVAFLEIVQAEELLTSIIRN
jgi:dTDP-4-dehydrorhamnose reductase